MRGCVILSVLALAGCGEHLGWNPNYAFGPGRYGEYLTMREVALVTDTESPRTIPVARPFYAPTGAEIAGRCPVPVPPVMGVKRIIVANQNPPIQRLPQCAVAPVVIVPDSMAAGRQPQQ